MLQTITNHISGGGSMAANSAKGKQGKRYSIEEKAEIIEFIANYNAANKRGGMKTASEKYGVSVVTLSNWSKKKKGPKGRKTKVKTRAKKASAPKVAVAAAKEMGDNPDAIISRLQAIRSEIATLEKEYNMIKKQL